jgi:thioredoxin-like negative regulator of GroEL
MPSIRFMKTTDFSVDSNKSLVSSIKDGYSLILFHSTRCPHCNNAREILSRLNETVVGCKFGMINLDEQKGIVSTANKSNLKIEYVPLFVFFANGTAYMMYAGPLDEGNIRQFIEQVAQSYADEYTDTGGEQRTLIDNFEGCNVNDEVCKADYVKRQQGCYVTMAEAYGNAK